VPVFGTAVSAQFSRSPADADPQRGHRRRSEKPVHDAGDLS